MWCCWRLRSQYYEKGSRWGNGRCLLVAIEDSSQLQTSPQTFGHWSLEAEKKAQQEGSEHVARFLYGLYNLYNVLSGLCCCIFTAACSYANWIKDSTVHLLMLQAHTHILLGRVFWTCRTSLRRKGKFLKSTLVQTFHMLTGMWLSKHTYVSV